MPKYEVSEPSASDLLNIKWLEETRLIFNNLDKAAEAMILLKDKRVTLEERYISHYLQKLSSKYLSLLTGVHTLLVSEYSDKQLKEVTDILVNLNSLDLSIESLLADFIKVIKYNPNFLEQYYEHEFHEKLLYDEKFIERLEDLSSSLSKFS